ncbi:hypothetical protein BN136_2712 [Cronobacter universalis NCTC 9529]|nr:hypothetical protein BN136_2712 [Cronobacter universalis NCTC 9529]
MTFGAFFFLPHHHCISADSMRQKASSAAAIINCPSCAKPSKTYGRFAEFSRLFRNGFP